MTVMARRRPVSKVREPGLTIPVRHIIGNAAVRYLCGGITRHTLIRWRAGHGFPEPIRQTDEIELWDAREVRAWINARNHTREES